MSEIGGKKERSHVGKSRHTGADRYTAAHIVPRVKKERPHMIRKFSSLAIWVVLGVAVALAPLACSSDSNTPDSGSVADTGAGDHANADSATNH
jgi:hypothetical protein